MTLTPEPGVFVQIYFSELPSLKGKHIRWIFKNGETSIYRYPEQGGVGWAITAIRGGGGRRGGGNQSIIELKSQVESFNLGKPRFFFISSATKKNMRHPFITLKIMEFRIVIDFDHKNLIF